MKKLIIHPELPQTYESTYILTKNCNIDSYELFDEHIKNKRVSLFSVYWFVVVMILFYYLISIYEF